MISELIEAFKKEGSNLSSRSGGILKAAIAMLQEIAPKETELQETELQETELTELYKACDIIIVGAIIFILAFEDKKYGPQKLFGNQCLYPIALNDPKLKPGDQEQNQEVINRYGRMALVDKTLPFTGVIRKDVFPQLSAIAPPSNFENYDLDTNPQTMDTTERSRPFHEKRERQEKEKTLAFMKLKWNRPFGWFESNNMGIPILGARREIKGFNLRKADVSKAFDTQESNYSSAAKWGWRALVVLLALFPPTLCFTIPLIREKEKKENAEKKELPVQKRIFTLEEYEDIRNTRAKLKELLKIAPQVSETKDEKFKKVCIAYNEKGEEVSYKYKVKKIEMYCDKYQAKRWDPTFLNSLIKKAKSESEKERKLARAEYILSKFNSETINSFPPFNSFTR